MSRLDDARALVLCADDYALDEGVSSGIVALARQGHLSATSVMVRSPRWAHDAPALRELQGQLDVGVHLDWTSDFARADGEGASLSVWMGRAVVARWRGAAVHTRLCEGVERQLDAFEAHWKRPPDHIDGHQHVHQFAGVREAVWTVLQRRYGAARPRPWLRVADVAQAGLKGVVISAWGGAAMRRTAQALAWPYEAPLSGVYGFSPHAGVYARQMMQWLRVLPARAVMMCHPAAQSVSGDPIRAARLHEFAFLKSEAFAQALQAYRVQLVRGGAA